MNPYNFFGVLIHVPQEDELQQMVQAGDLTTSTEGHIIVKAFSRYNEWNENFNFMR